MNRIRRGTDLGRRVMTRNKVTVVTAVVVALVTSGTTAAASYLVLATTNSASSTTTLRSATNGAVLSLQNTNSNGGTSAKGLSISVPAGRPPITVNSSAGKATNLNADKLDGISSSGFVRKTTSAWHEVNTGGEPLFWCNPQVGFCPWSNFGNGYNTVAFMKDALGFVHLKGLIWDANISFQNACHEWAFFQLPTGYRPAKIVIAPTLHNDQTARVDVLSTGLVTICTPGSVTAPSWFSLDGISFQAGQ